MGTLLEMILWLLPDALISIFFGDSEKEQETRIIPPSAKADDDLA